MKKLASKVRKGDRILIDGERHVAIADAAPMTFEGTRIASVPDNDRDAEETYTDFGQNDDVETWS